MNSYTLKYDLEGGIGQNPTSYTEADEIRLNAPLRPGYRFIGWQGSPAVIPKGSHGDRVLTAKWNRINASAELPLKKNANYGCDNGIAHTAEPSPISLPDRKGSNGEDIYTVKTVYTDIAIDGIKDAAYDYGLHLRSDLSTDPEYYADKNTGFDVFVIRGQDGCAYLFFEVTDPDVIVPDELWKNNIYRCDGIHVYSDLHGIIMGADPNCKRSRGTSAANYAVVLTEKGYNIELRIQNTAGFFNNGDLLQISFFMCDLVKYENLGNYKKNNLRVSSALSGREKYTAPKLEQNDIFAFSTESATGKELIDEYADLMRTDDLIADIISGARKTAIVYGKDSSAYTVTSLGALTRYLNSFCAPISVIRENDARRSEFDTEILIGVTADGKNRELIEKTPYNGYGVKFSDSNISLVGWREEAFDKALGVLISAIDHVRMGGRTGNLDSLYIGEFGSIPGKNIPKINDFVTVTDAGDGAYCVLVKPASTEKYEDYKTSLEKAGFALHASNKMNTLLCHTYYDDSAVITLTYDTNPDNGNDMRLVVEPRAMTTLPSAEPQVYTPVCKSSITQVSPNRMTYIIKLDNGEFIIADSGQNRQHSYIYNELMRLSDDGKPVIALWTFSHFHQDHNGGFVEFVQNEEYMKNVTVKAVLYNTPEYQLISLASNLDKKNMAIWESLLDRHGIVRYQTRTGQRFRFANAEIEVLYTYEDLMPFFIYKDRSNPSSFVYRLTIDGQRFIITGDCCSEASSLMVARYGDTLKADFVQLPHHGHGDGGTDPMFYEKVNADYVLWPGEPARLSPAEAGAIKKVKKYFVMCEGTVTLEIPYKD